MCPLGGTSSRETLMPGSQFRTNLVLNTRVSTVYSYMCKLYVALQGTVGHSYPGTGNRGMHPGHSARAQFKGTTS